MKSEFLDTFSLRDEANQKLNVEVEISRQRLVLYKAYISFLKDKDERVSSMYLAILLLSKTALSLCDEYVIEDQDPLIPILQKQRLNASTKKHR
jgi:hypothetical protein